MCMGPTDTSTDVLRAPLGPSVHPLQAAVAAPEAQACPRPVLPRRLRLHLHLHLHLPIGAPVVTHPPVARFSPR